MSTNRLTDLAARKEALQPKTARANGNGRMSHDDGFDPLYLAVGAKIRALREQRRLTAEQLAKAAKIARVGLIRLELHGQRMALHNLYVLAYLLDVSIYDLLPAQLPGMEDGDA